MIKLSANPTIEDLQGHAIAAAFNLLTSITDRGLGSAIVELVYDGIAIPVRIHAVNPYMDETPDGYHFEIYTAESEPDLGYGENQLIEYMDEFDFTVKHIAERLPLYQLGLRLLAAAPDVNTILGKTVFLTPVEN